MNQYSDFKLPLLSGVLYGLSWPLLEGINFSFLAWGAFVPLLIFLKNNQGSFSKSAMGSYLAFLVFGCLSAGWLFSFPEAKSRVAIIFFLEELWACFPFILFYPLHRKLGFDRALWLFPLLWMCWEWTFLPLEFTMGTHLSPYSQSSNLWLVQFIDLTGMWAVSAWLMLFNVLVFKAFQQTHYQWKAALLSRQLLVSVALMLGVPLLYAAYAFSAYGSPASHKALSVSVVPTHYSADFLSDFNNWAVVTEETLYRTDTLAFLKWQQNQRADLYVWPETGLNFGLQAGNLQQVLQESTTDWEAALLTGGKSLVNPADSTDFRQYVSAVLLSATTDQPEFHHKTVLTPGNESVPYHAALATLPSFPFPENDPRFYQKGAGSQPLPLKTRNGQTFSVGASLCYEQWFPQHWAALARNGAELYVHMAAEGWYGNVGFQQFMANVTRMRCIENRKPAARCANVGLSLFIDRLGNYHHQVPDGSKKTMTANLYATDEITFYARFPNWFPVLGGLLFLGLLTIGQRNKVKPPTVTQAIP